MDVTATKQVKAEATAGQMVSKDEVVYATLNAIGDLNDIYVVNTLDIAKAGTILSKLNKSVLVFCYHSIYTHSFLRQ